MPVKTKTKVAEEFGKYGLELVDFFINAITPPEEVQKAIDARSSMGAVGDLNAFLKFQAANSMAKMAEQGGGGGGLGQGALGMGMGAGFGMMMPGMIREAMAGGGASVAGPCSRTSRRCRHCRGWHGGHGAEFRQPASRRGRSQGGSTNRGYRGRIQNRRVGRRHANHHSRGPALRKQRVTVEFGQKDADGNAIVNYWSVCGPFLEKNAAALLQYNTSTIHGAFAVKTIADKQMVVLQTNQPADTISALEVSKVLAAIAWQADQVEQKLLGTDEN